MPWACHQPGHLAQQHHHGCLLRGDDHAQVSRQQVAKAPEVGIGFAIDFAALPNDGGGFFQAAHSLRIRECYTADELGRPDYLTNNVLIAAGVHPVPRAGPSPGESGYQGRYSPGGRRPPTPPRPAVWRTDSRCLANSAGIRR